MPTRPQRRRGRLFAVLACALGLGGCGGGGGAPDVPPVFPADALLAAMTEGGLALELRTSPQPLARGNDAVEMRFIDASGMPAAGLAVTVLPWMPAHGHGTSIKPAVTETEPGVYVVAPLYLYMAGAWTLYTTLAGAVNDTVTLGLDVP